MNAFAPSFLHFIEETIVIPHESFGEGEIMPMKYLVSGHGGGTNKNSGCNVGDGSRDVSSRYVLLSVY